MTASTRKITNGYGCPAAWATWESPTTRSSNSEMSFTWSCRTSARRSPPASRLVRLSPSKLCPSCLRPITGRVTAVNDHIRHHPETVNTDPHGTWIIKLDVSDPGEAASLLDSKQYQDLLG